MNEIVNLGGGLGPSLGVLAAGALLAYGVWTGRRDLGMRGAWGVLAATALSLLLPYLMMAALRWRTGGGSLPALLLLSGLLSLLLAFFPLYVAANWLEIIRRVARSETGNPPA